MKEQNEPDATTEKTLSYATIHWIIVNGVA